MARIWFLVFLVLIAAPSSSARTELPTSVAADLERAASEMLSLCAEWRSQDKALADDEALAAVEIDSYGPAFWEPMVTRYQYEAGRYDAHIELKSSLFDSGSSASTRMAPSKKDAYFDGEILEHAYNGRLDREPIASVATRKPLARILLEDYWPAAGWKFPNLMIDHARKPHHPLLLDLATQGAELVSHPHEEVDGHSCVVFSATLEDRQWKFWLDPELLHATRRWELLTSDGLKIETSHCSDFRPIHDGSDVQLPWAVRTEHYTMPRGGLSPAVEPYFAREFEVRTLTVPCTLEAKSLRARYPAGSEVLDFVHSIERDGKKSPLVYQLPADLADLDAVIEHARNGTPFIPRPLERPTRWPWILILVNALIVAAIAVALIIRRSSSS